jgi:hypothetical protein
MLRDELKYFIHLLRSNSSNRLKPPSSRSPRAASSPLCFETLERRQLLTVVASTSLASELATPLYQEAMTVNSKGVAVPLASSGPTGYTPAQIRAAYGFNQITFDGGTVAGNGAGETIAIVDAYSDPNIVSDLHQFDQAFGLADPTLSVVNQTGGSSLPAGNTGWATEIALDVEWAHAIAPGAKILLVEANSSSFSDLLTAVNYARNASGVVAVSMSWGGSEFSSEKSMDSYFTTPTGHAGVTFVVASGDSGAPAEYPSASPDVIAVGGTTLKLNSNGTIASETAWSGSTGGLSAYESQPTYQNGVVTQSTTARATPDVSYDSDPNTGFPVYDSYGNSSPWGQYGGTSDAAPQWAALVAIADEGRTLEGLSSLSGSQVLADLYQSTGDFHDITSGTTTGSPRETATAGYDLATGIGSPIANLLVNVLDGGGTTTPPAATHLSLSAPSSVTAGSTFSLTVTALSASNTTATGYLDTVQFSSTGGLTGLPSSYTFTAADDGVHTFTGLTLSTTGTQTIAATDATTKSITGSTSILVNPVSVAAATHFSISAPSTSVAGSAFSVTVIAQTSSNSTATGYTGTVHFTTSDTASGVVLPAAYTFTAADKGVHTFTNLVALDTAGAQLITATDKSSGSITGSATTKVTPAAANHLVFSQQPSAATAGSVIAPAVTVKILDQYGNLLNTDNTDTVTISLATNPAGGTLSGTLTATVSGGVATFSNLSINQAGNGYVLGAKSGSLAAITSAAFNVTSNVTTGSTVIEGFESGNLNSYKVVDGNSATASVSTSAAHDGKYGLLDSSGNDWIYRNDAAAQVAAGDTLTVWVRFSGSATGRAYFGFGAGPNGTLSLVAAPNTNQLILQINAGYGYTDLADVNQTWSANQWYKLEVDWSTSGEIIGKLYASNGTTLLNTVTASNTTITSGGIAFRGFGSPVDWDTVTMTPNVNTFGSVKVTTTVGSGTTRASTAPSSQTTFGGVSGKITSSSAFGFTAAQLAATDAIHASGELQDCGIDDLLTTVTSGLLLRRS